MYQDIIEITENSHIVTTLSNDKVPFPFFCHVVTYLNDPSKGYPKAHRHNLFEIHYVIRGVHRAVVNHVSYETKQGEILIVMPNEEHYSDIPDETTVNFRIMFDNEYLTSLGISFKGLSLPPQIKDDPFLLQTMETMYQDAIAKRPQNYLNNYALGLQFMIYLLRNCTKTVFLPEHQTESKLQMVENAIKYMETHYSEDFNLQELAGRLGYSQCYFSRTFGQVMGISAAKYLQRLRCINARDLLQTGLYTVTEVADMCGFSNLSYFVKTYKAIMGNLPKQDSKKMQR